MAYRDLVLAKSPQLYWECQDTDTQTSVIVDSSGNGRPGTRVACVLESPAAGYGQPYSILLSAKADLIYRVDRTLLNRSRVCLAYVVRITAYPAVGHRAWFSTWGNQPGSSSQNDKGVILNADGTLTMYVYSNGGERLVTGTKAIGLGPHHIVLTVDGNGSILWVDGQPYITQSAYTDTFDGYDSATLYFADFPNAIPSIPTANTDHGAFYLTDVALFATSLTAAEIQSLALAAITAAVLKGTALLSTGAAASLILIRKWATYELVMSIVPGSDGKWSAAVAPGEYEITARGPAGYQPITHGPVTTS